MEPLKSLDHLMELVDQRRAIVFQGRRLPAAVVANFQCSALRRYMEMGDVFIYPKPAKKTKE